LTPIISGLAQIIIVTSMQNSHNVQNLGLAPLERPLEPFSVQHKRRKMVTFFKEGINLNYIKIIFGKKIKLGHFRPFGDLYLSPKEP
jgi:hypothetical protein